MAILEQVGATDDLMSLEMEYHSSLNVLLNFKKSLQKSCSISQHSLNLIFDDLDQLQALSRDLISEYVVECQTPKSSVDILLGHLAEFRTCYSRYGLNQGERLKQLGEWTKVTKSFAAQTLRHLEDVQKVSLETLLLRPMHHLECLVRLLDTTETRDAHASFSEILLDLETERKRAERHERWTEVMKRLTINSVSDLTAAPGSDQQVYFEGELGILDDFDGMRRYHGILFSEVLALVEIRGMQWSLAYWFPLERLAMGTRHRLGVFRVTMPFDTLIVAAPSTDLKVLWNDMLDRFKTLLVGGKSFEGVFYSNFGSTPSSTSATSLVSELSRVPSLLPATSSFLALEQGPPPAKPYETALKIFSSGLPLVSCFGFSEISPACSSHDIPNALQPHAQTLHIPRPPERCLLKQQQFKDPRLRRYLKP